jgi:N-acetylglucosamine-1-phosphate uridyltransferase (contains nucleotidyltransferase and I-patch acetyltransferase domains)
MAYWLFSKKNPMKNLEIIILAAGKGTRMKSSKPKIFHDLGGKQIIDYVIDASTRLKPKRIHLVVNNQIKNNFRYNNNLNIVIQNKQNGTGDAIKSAINSLGKDSVTLVLYGDVPLIKYKTIINVSKIKTNTVNLLCFNKEERNNYGKVILGTEGLISHVIEQKELKKNENYYLCKTGIFAIETKLLSSLLPK